MEREGDKGAGMLSVFGFDVFCTLCEVYVNCIWNFYTNTGKINAALSAPTSRRFVE